tara:strand:+ start:38 stop:469 length:432 start_codon:yes stop_codon:yes gene_type:complete
MFSLRHIGITVQDMEKSLELYRDYFRFQVVWDEIEQGKFIDGLSGIDDIVVRTVKLKDFVGGMVELLEYKSHPQPLETLRPIVDIGVSHFAMTVQNLDTTYDDLIEMGLIFNAKPAISPDGNAKVCFCRDFDGTLIELVEVLN